MVNEKEKILEELKQIKDKSNSSRYEFTNESKKKEEVISSLESNQEISVVSKIIN